MPIHSLEPITKIIDTGQRPVVVSCADFSDYICKYSRNTPANTLMIEWICACAAQAVGLSIPSFDFVAVHPEHVPKGALLQQTGATAFQGPLFGSRYLSAKHVDQMVLTMLGNNRRKTKILNKEDLLRIALFDIWISNEDRHQNNYNLLLNESDAKYQFYVIDHGAAFNTQAALNFGLTPLTWEDSIVSSPLFALIYNKPRNFANRIENTINELDGWRDAALQSIEHWCVDIPPAWAIDFNLWNAFLREQWLSEEWLLQTKQTFREHLQFFINP